jgi:hypothetical protein
MDGSRLNVPLQKTELFQRFWREVYCKVWFESANDRESQVSQQYDKYTQNAKKISLFFKDSVAENLLSLLLEK